MELVELRAKALVVRGVLTRARNKDWGRWPKDLSGACGLAANLLHQLLGLQPVVGYVDGGEVDGSSHCWNLWRGRIVDITATQFGISDPVYVPEQWDKRYGEGGFWRKKIWVKTRGVEALGFMQRCFDTTLTFPGRELLERTKEALRRAEERRR